MLLAHPMAVARLLEPVVFARPSPNERVAYQYPQCQCGIVVKVDGFRYRSAPSEPELYRSCGTGPNPRDVNVVHISRVNSMQ